MSLQSLLDLKSSFGVKDDISEERLRKCLPQLKKQIAFYRAYPDIFVDDLSGYNQYVKQHGTDEGWKGFKFFYFQRITLRVLMRHRKTYIVFSRGFSKSFLSMMALMLKAILYPNSELFITTGGKAQAASITCAKIDEICKIIPALSNEIDWSRGKTKHSKDEVKYIFKNGSYIDVLPALESSRGQRRTGGLFEECVLIDPDALNDIIIPCCVINRRLPNGKRIPDEIVNQAETYITTAGYKDSFAYTRLIELLAESIMEPDEVMIMGGTWQIPVNEGLQPKNFIQNLKLQGTFDASSFDREWGSRWTGDSEKSYYSSEAFDKCRELLQPEYEHSGRASKNAYYILGVDVGRKGDTSEISVIKVTPQPQGASLKSVVCFYSKANATMREQAVWIKRLFIKYKARTVVVDGNGIGVNLVDELAIGQDDPETGDYLPPLGIEGGTYESVHDDIKKFRSDDAIKDAMFIIKANAPINTEAHSYLRTQIDSKKIRFLIEERDARIKLMETKVGQNMTPEERNDKLMPFQLTDNLKTQLGNLIEENEGVNIILKKNNKSIPKDRFSSLEYALYYIKQEEERRKKRKGRSMADFMFFS